MQERSLFWQAVGALLISVIILGTLLLAAWFGDRAQEALVGSSPPLPTGLPPSSAYILTILAAFVGLLAGGVTYVGVRQAKYVTKQFAWLVYLLVTVPSVLLLITPLQRGGHDTFNSLPVWLVSIPGRMVVATALGALFIGLIDLRRILPKLLPDPNRPRQRAASTAVRGLPGRFTPQGWRALSFMQEEAQRFEHAYMGTEHLLLGMLHDNRSQATRVLVNLGVEPGSVRTQLEGVIGRRGSLYTGGTGMTRRCQRVIEGAARIARSEGQRTVGTGQLLQSLVESADDVAGQLLEGLGVTAERVATEIRHLGPEGE